MAFGKNKKQEAHERPSSPEFALTTSTAGWSLFLPPSSRTLHLFPSFLALRSFSMTSSSRVVVVPKRSPPLLRLLSSAVVTGRWMLPLLLLTLPFQGGRFSKGPGVGGVHAFSLWVAPSLRQYLATPTTATTSPAGRLFGSDNDNDFESSASWRPHRGAAPILVGTGLRTAARTIAMLRESRCRVVVSGGSTNVFRSSLTMRSLGGLFASIEADDDDNDLPWDSDDDETNSSAALVHEMATFLAVRLGKTFLQSIRTSNDQTQQQHRKIPLRQALPLQQEEKAQVGVGGISASTPVVAVETTAAAAMGDATSAEPLPSLPSMLPIDAASGSSSSNIEGGDDDGHHPRTLHQREGDRVLALGDDFSIESPKTDTSSTTSSISSESVTAGVFTPPANGEVAVEARAVETPPVPEEEGNVVEAVVPVTSFAPPTDVAVALGPAVVGPPPVPTAVSLDFGKPLEVVTTLPPPPVQSEQAWLSEQMHAATDPKKQDPVPVAPDDTDVFQADVFQADAMVDNTDAMDAGDAPESNFFALETLTDLTLEGDDGDAASSGAAASATEASPVAGSGFVLLSPPSPAPAPSTVSPAPTRDGNEPERELAMAAAGPSKQNPSSSRDDAGASGFTKRRTSNATTDNKSSTSLSGAALLDAEVASATPSSTSTSSLDDHMDYRDIQDRDTMDIDIEQQRQILLESFRRSADAMESGTLDDTEAAIATDTAPTNPTAEDEDGRTMATLPLDDSALDMAFETLEVAPDTIEAVAKETTELAAEAARIDEASVSLPRSPTPDTDSQPSSADGDAPHMFVDDLPTAATQPPKARSSLFSPFGQGWKTPHPIEPELVFTGESELGMLGSDAEPVLAEASVDAAADFAVDGASSHPANAVQLPTSPVDDVGPSSWMSVSIESEERGTIAESILPMDPRTFSSLTESVEPPAPFDDSRRSMAAANDPPASPLSSGSTKNKWNPFQSSAGAGDTSRVPPVGRGTADGNYLEASADTSIGAADVTEYSEPKADNNKDRWNPYSRTATDAPPKSNLGVFDPWKAWMNTVVDGGDKSATVGGPSDGVSLPPASSKINYSGFGSKPRAAETSDGYLGGLRSDSADSKPDVVAQPEPQAFLTEAQQPPTPPLVVDDRRSEFSLGYRWTGSNWASSSLKPRMAKPPSFKDQDPMELHPLHRTESGGYVWYTIPKFPDVPQWRSFAKYSGIHWTHPEHEDIDSSDDANYY